MKKNSARKPYKRNAWVMIHNISGKIGWACPDLEVIPGGGWILYIEGKSKGSTRCHYFGGNLAAYKKEGWSVLGSFN